jgi:hypothetical protein
MEETIAALSVGTLTSRMLDSPHIRDRVNPRQIIQIKAATRIKVAVIRTQAATRIREAAGILIRLAARVAATRTRAVEIRTRAEGIPTKAEAEKAVVKRASL